MEKYLYKKNKNILKLEEALLLDAKKAHLHYKSYINPQLANLLSLLGLSKNFVKAQNTKVWDEEGQEYIDFLGAYGALNIGHNNQHVINKMEKIKELPNLLQTAINPITTVLAKNLEAITPENLIYTFFCNSGAEAVEGALKLAKIATGKSRILYCTGSFHGKSMGALSVTGRDKYKKYFQPLVPLSEEVPYGDLQSLKGVLEKYDDIAAFIVEPIQGEGGIIVPPKGYLKGVERLCKEQGVLLIADEVQTGFGRTGYWFACDEEMIAPDILCMAKSLGGGIMPIGAYITTEEVWSKSYGSMEKCLLHTSTFGGNTWASAAGIATIEYIDQYNLDVEAKAKGEYFINKLESLRVMYPLLKEVRGKGLMIGLEFETIKDNRFFNKLVKGNAADTLEEYTGGLIATELLNQHRIITAYTLNNPNVIRIEPPLTITYDEIDYFVKSLNTILNKYKGVTELVMNNFKNIFQSILRR
ncbi:putrescine aminotransferase [Natronincola peptidivorans]|uniref:Putrescine aminotransferase n=1 Tax=Natronincola peptidivorans TaxID=426128 RepID=A0A1I0BYW3_9FIRM|nr:aspartate aminotransferase family protein [Natronincola peptidivorans]SET12391.1 putrescine aminotransferase [Natronincola peptidivorans]